MANTPSCSFSFGWHMTGNTIILIDEIETHLHTKYMNRMFQALKALVIGDVPLRISSTRS